MYNKNDLLNDNFYFPDNDFESSQFNYNFKDNNYSEMANDNLSDYYEESEYRD